MDLANKCAYRDWTGQLLTHFRVHCSYHDCIGQLVIHAFLHCSRNSHLSPAYFKLVACPAGHGNNNLPGCWDLGGGLPSCTCHPIMRLTQAFWLFLWSASLAQAYELALWEYNYMYIPKCVYTFSHSPKRARTSQHFLWSAILAHTYELDLRK